MSRHTLAPASARSLSLTEELEKLEQSITLTLQEIDKNFSKSHRIVTGSILPIVEQYGEHSKAVWEASKFWKQFFEASANVSLSNYEEVVNPDEEEETMTATNEDFTARDEIRAEGGTYTPQHQRQHQQADSFLSQSQADESSDFQDQDTHRGAEDDFTLTDEGGTLTGSTPRPPRTQSIAPAPQFAGLGSPYDLLQQKMKKEGNANRPGQNPADDQEEEDDTELIFQQHTARLPNFDLTPRTSSTRPSGPGQRQDSQLLFSGQKHKAKDPLMHRVLDKNYRLLATPMKGYTGLPGPGVSPIRWQVTAAKQPSPEKKTTRPAWEDSPMSSPEIAMPKLRSAYMSPVKYGGKGRVGQMTAGQQPRTPGVSVQTPAAAAGGTKTRDVYAQRKEKTPVTQGRYEDEITWESDEDDVYGGMSPPKTIQFAVPQSRLLQTPAREASKRIVEDILMTAGDELDGSEYSPTMVKMNPILDDSF